MEDNDKMYKIYSELDKLVGRESMLKIYNQYKGQLVNFPQRIYKSDYVKQYIQENSTEHSSSIAKKFNYSERWVQELKRKNKNTIC